MSRLARSSIALVVGLLIYLGLPLIGWGVADAEGFLSHPALLAYVILVLVLHGYVVLSDPGVGRDRGAGKVLVRRQRWAVLLLQVLTLAVLLAAPYSDHRGVLVFRESAWVRYLGLAMFGSGFLVMNWAEATLGRHFSIQVTVQEDHNLVTSGPYRFIRHPRYLGILLYNFGLAFAFRSGLGLMLVAALALVLFWRIHDEEALMHQQFGAEWEGYALRSSRLVPFLF